MASIAKSATRTEKSEAEVHLHNSLTKLHPVNFEIGVFVLVADLLTMMGNKLRVDGNSRVILYVPNLTFSIRLKI